MDVSSYQPRDLTALITAHSIEHVVVRLYTKFENPPQQHSIDQIKSALDNGCTVGGYMWLYPGGNPTPFVESALAILPIKIPVLWIDCESYLGRSPTFVQIAQAVDAVQKAGYKPGIYTADWWWPNINLYAHLPLWAAEYDYSPDIDAVIPFGGWSHFSGKQYTSNPVDLNTFRYEVTK